MEKTITITATIDVLDNDMEKLKKLITDALEMNTILDNIIIIIK